MVRSKCAPRGGLYIVARAPGRDDRNGCGGDVFPWIRAALRAGLRAPMRYSVAEGDSLFFFFFSFSCRGGSGIFVYG